ncbi:8-amino-7-oxononanoate synthase [Paenibacillus sp. SC116]|uniref:aminotransferase class I/II-fold pyridoxal phosphate-dependent enzyme n=1 Tax=Paenibacillus sp. SC116 TaxID=2968986 RepID=UPI00215B49DA|nr:8-amino-7-oxononanoate synthase [Paenibacillus sp. SC116]MCR8846515.1 8-amino-7-oxononanoate synthase [Paenibacillus sp. SC116]
MSSTRYDWMHQELERLEAEDRLRSMTESHWLDDGFMERDGVRMLNLASNHYLGLNPWLDDCGWEQVKAWCRQYGEPGVRIGSGASRLISGHDGVHAQLEREIAKFKGRQAALVFTSGYMANVGSIAALVGRNDAVFSDRLNHASIVDGALLSRAHMYRYSHLDMNKLEYQLQQWSKTLEGKRNQALIVSDAVFSMDGTVAPLRDLVLLKERYNALLLIDEAHSSGVYGAKGRGLCHELGMHERVDIVMGTFGKAFGAVGAYIAADDIVIRYMINRARTLIYNTGLPPLMAALILMRLEQVKDADDSRIALMRNAVLLREGLKGAGLNAGVGNSHIVPLILGTDERAVAISRKLAQSGIAGIAIRPPTVPEGTARIRFTPMASQSEDELRKAVSIITKVVRET